jgi:hypothetical protein
MKKQEKDQEKENLLCGEIIVLYENFPTDSKSLLRVLPTSHLRQAENKTNAPSDGSLMELIISYLILSARSHQ